MRKKEKEITDFEEIEAILMRNIVCRIAFSRDNVPYIIPLNYGYKDRIIYIHTGYKGQKIEFLNLNPHVCVEIDDNHKIILADKACRFSMKYESVVATGQAEIVEEENEKKQALDILMTNLGKKSGWEYDKTAFGKVCVIKVSLDRITGRRSIS